MINIIVYLIARSIGFAGGYGGGPMRSMLAGVISFLMMHVSPQRRRVTKENISRALPMLGEIEIDRILKSSYMNFARCYVELFSFPHMDVDDIRNMFHCVEPDEIRLNKSKGRGAILISAHMGNWELAVPAVARKHELPTLAIAKPQRNPYVNRYINDCRQTDLVKVVSMHEAAKEIIKTLNDKGLVCMMLDQAADPTKDVFVDFFGIPAVTFEAPATLALRFQADIIVAVAIRNANGTYDIATSRIDTSGIDDDEQGRRDIVQRCTTALERHIRKNPEQWSWQHKRWKYNPEEYKKGAAR